MLLNDPLPMACKNRANMWCSTSRSFTCTLKLFEIKSLYMFIPEEINAKLKRHSFCLSTTKSYQQSLLITRVPSVKMYIDIVLALRFQFFCPYVSLDIFLKLPDSGSDRCFGKSFVRGKTWLTHVGWLLGMPTTDTNPSLFAGGLIPKQNWKFTQI